MQKRKKIPALLLTLLLMLVLAPAAYADTDANTPQITQQPDQLVLQLGARWAGVEFELRTDAGVFPVPVVVDESGILRMDLGGSTTYTLSCINSTVPIPDPEPTEPDTPPTTQQDPAPSQPPTNNTSGSNTRTWCPWSSSSPRWHLLSWVSLPSSSPAAAPGSAMPIGTMRRKFEQTARKISPY